MAGGILAREAARTGRRLQTWVLRVGWAGALALFTLYTWRELEGTTDVAALAPLGRDLFLSSAALQAILLVPLVPVVIGQGVVEERLDRTLDILALTRLTPARILASKLGFRLMILLGIATAPLPIFAIGLQLGGVSALEFCAALAGLATEIAVLTAFSAAVSAHARSPLAPLATTAVFAFFAFLLLPALLADNDHRIVTALSPVFFHEIIDGRSFLPAIFWAPTVLGLLRYGSLSFQAATTEDLDWRRDVPLLLSLDRWTSWASLVVGAAALLPLPMHELLDAAGASEREQKAAIVIGWAIATHGGTLLFVQIAGGILRNVATGGLGARSWVRPLRGRVWGEPIVWRELATRATGAIGLLPVVGFGLWGIFGLLVASSSNRREMMLVAMLGLAGAASSGALVGVASTAEERRAGTLEVMMASPFPPARIVLGKFAAGFVRVLPFALLAAFCFGYADRYESYGHYGSYGEELTHNHSTFGRANFLPERLLVREIAIGAWGSSWAAATVGLAMLAGARLPPAAAWPAALVGPWSVGVLSILLLEMRNRSPGAHLASSVLLPVGDALACPFGGVPPELAASTILYAAAAALSVGITAVRLRRWSLHV